MRLFVSLGRLVWTLLMMPFGVTILAVTLLATAPLLFVQLALGRQSGPADWIADWGTRRYALVMTPWEVRA